jgi:hypothetical protein
MADEQVPDIPVAAPRSRRLLRLFLMVAGGLAAPCLALAAFFLSGSGGAETPSRPKAAQSGLVTGTTAPRRTPAAPVASTTTTTAPVIPAAPAGPLRDPFAPLVTQAPAAGAPAR